MYRNIIIIIKIMSEHIYLVLKVLSQLFSVKITDGNISYLYTHKQCILTHHSERYFRDDDETKNLIIINDKN